MQIMNIIKDYWFPIITFITFSSLILALLKSARQHAKDNEKSIVNIVAKHNGSLAVMITLALATIPTQVKEVDDEKNIDRNLKILKGMVFQQTMNIEKLRNLINKNIENIDTIYVGNRFVQDIERNLVNYGRIDTNIIIYEAQNFRYYTDQIQNKIISKESIDPKFLLKVRNTGLSYFASLKYLQTGNQVRAINVCEESNFFKDCDQVTHTSLYNKK